jgi:peptidoglycan hydrolase-like protein with peptidoglycan-binding domain
MRSFKNEIIAAILFAFMGLPGAYAQSEIIVSWEIRGYYIDADSPKVEVLLSVNDREVKKEFVFFAAGDAGEIPESGQYILSTWFEYTTYFYRFLVENGNIVIQKEKVEYLKEAQYFVPVSPGWQEFKRITITPGKAIIRRSGETVPAKNLFHRPLSLQGRRMNGDDVWALQRFLVEQGYDEVGIVDGWFGPNTEKAVKRFQNNNAIPEDGVVGQETWDLLSGLEKEQVNFFQGDYDD